MFKGTERISAAASAGTAEGSKGPPIRCAPGARRDGRLERPTNAYRFDCRRLPRGMERAVPLRRRSAAGGVRALGSARLGEGRASDGHRPGARVVHVTTSVRAVGLLHSAARVCRPFVERTAAKSVCEGRPAAA